MVDALNEARMLVGRGLADQGCQSLADIRGMYNSDKLGLRIVSPGASMIAGHHRGKNG